MLLCVYRHTTCQLTNVTAIAESHPGLHENNHTDGNRAELWKVNETRSELRGTISLLWLTATRRANMNNESKYGAYR